MLAVVFGVFDIFHVGHLHILESAAQHGKVAVVIPDDASVSVLKGKDRPIFKCQHRFRMLRSIRYVDQVRVIRFTRETLDFAHGAILKDLKPDVFVQGSQARHTFLSVVGELGIPIVTVPSLDVTSSTALIETARPEEYYFPQ